MFDLILAIIFSAMIPVILKYAHKKNLSDEVILTFNYIIAIVISILFTLNKIEIYKTIINHNVLLLILIGILTGLAFYGGFYFYQKSVKENGVSISIAVGKMGIIIPMFLSLILWKEVPTLIQWIGIVISLTAISIININPKDFKTNKIRSSLILFFIIGGLGDFFNKLFEVTVGSEFKDLFLIFVFSTAFVASLYNTIKNKNINKLSVIYGILLGLPNMLTVFFLINSFSKVNATVVFPMYSGGAIMLSTIWSIFAFGERLKLIEGISIILILVALVLINL